MRIKRYKSSISGEVIMLVDKAGMPLDFANRYAYTMIEKRGRSRSSIEQALFVISRLYLWAEIRDINLDQRLFYGGFLTADHMSDLVEFLYFTSITQNQILSAKQKKPKVNFGRGGNVLNFNKSAEIEYQYTSNHTFANRLRALIKFIEWIITERHAQRIITPKLVIQRSKLALIKVENSIPRVSSIRENEKLEAVDLDLIERISIILHPEHTENPFSTLFIRHRNYLLLLLLIESGARRGEVYHTQSKDIIASEMQYDIKISKTVPRTLPVSKLLINAFEMYHQNYWRHLNGSGKKSGFLFVKSNGERLSLRAINYVIETLRMKIPEIPAWFHTHTLRRTYNHRLSLLIDAKRECGFEISQEEERKMRNRLNGWVSNSSMGEIYNARYLREKTNRLAELLLNEIVKKGIGE